MTDPTHAKQEPRRGFGIMNNRPSTLRESASDPTSKPTVIVPDDRGHSITVLLCPCTRVEREKEKQDMLLSDTAPDAPKHDVISSPTDTFGVISSGAVWAAAGVRLTVRHTRQTDALAHLASSHMATCNSPISQRPTKNEVRIVSSQLSASSTMKQGPELFEVQPLLPTVRQNAHCRKLRTAQWKKDHGLLTLQSPEMLDSVVLPPGSCGTAASKRCRVEKGPAPLSSTVWRRPPPTLYAAETTDFVGCSIAPLTARWPDSR